MKNPIPHSPFPIPLLSLCFAHCALCIALSAFAAPPQDEAAQQKAAELAQLVRDNTAKADGMLRAMAEHGRKNEYAQVTNCSAQVAAMLALKEGAPSVTPYRIHMETARALSEKLHLHWAGLAAQHYAEALKLADTPRQKAEAIFAAGLLEYDVAADDDPAPAIAKIRSALAVPDLSKSDLLDLAFRYPSSIDPDFDVKAEAWKIAEGEPSLHGRYYAGILPPAPRGQSTTLNPSKSSERALEICRKAIADPAIRGGQREQFLNREIDALLDLGRSSEAEQRLLELAATTDQRSRAMWSKRLGDFYVESARRYYLPSHEQTLRKALCAYTDASLAAPNDGRIAETACAVALTLKDYLAAENAVTRRIEINKGVTNVWAWSQLGRIAYEKKDYASAASAFGAAEAGLDRSSRRLYARSLKALGRIEETIAQLEKIEKEDNRFMKGTDRYYIQYLKGRLPTAAP
jgi:tetratricopeptide (TPR) repeat protein